MNKLLNRIFVAIPLLLFYYLAFINNYVYYFCGLIITLFSLLETYNLKKNKKILFSITSISFFIFIKLSKSSLLKIIGVNILSDSTQLFFGKYLGNYINHKPFSKISPNKTTIGYLGGISSTLLINYYLNLFSFINCLIILLSGISGDLLFSYIKRNNKIKDYSFKFGNKTISLLGNHGGILDRFDSLHISSIVYYLSQIFVIQ
jgi:phosphatidate cytidylyltransferase